jgi:hypothetical protein
MKFHLKTKNGSQHSSTHKPCKTPKHRSPKRRISKIFRRRLKKHVNHSQKNQSSYKPMLICSRSDENSNDYRLGLKNPNNAENKLEDNHLLSSVSNINQFSNIISNEKMQPDSGLNFFSNFNNINNSNKIRFNDNNSNKPTLHESTAGFNTIEERSNENNLDSNNTNNTRERAEFLYFSNFFGNVNENTNDNIIPNYDTNHNITNRNNGNIGDVNDLLSSLEYISLK